MRVSSFSRVLVVLLGVFAVALLALPLAAVAAPNPPQVLDPPLVIVLPPDVTGCGFDVQITVTGKFKSILFPDGRQLVTAPGEKAVLVNLSNGHTVKLNITGAFHYTTAADGTVTVVATGRNLLWGGLENRLVLTRGNFTWTVYPDGSVSPQTGNGNKDDVCAMIA